MHYQYKGKYIMNAVKSGLMLIDQHRAHVRILYEEYLRREKDRQPTAQKILFPEMLQLTAAEAAVLHEMLPQMRELGFELSDLGAHSYAVNAIPVGLEGLNPVALVRDIIADAQQENVPQPIGQVDTLSLSLARHAAIPYGQILNNDEMENIVNSLFACSNVNYTPDGKKILHILPQQEIERFLG